MDIKKLLENRRAVNIIIIFLIGVCAVVIGGGMVTSGEKEVKKETSNEVVAADLERRLEKILSTIEGAGKVSVFVMLEDYGVNEYVKDTKQVIRENQSENEQETVMAGKTGDSAPVLSKVTLPKVKGVIVTAKGAGKQEVKERIKSAVETSLAVPSFRVEVVQMQ